MLLAVLKHNFILDCHRVIRVTKLKILIKMLRAGRSRNVTHEFIEN